MALYPLVMGRPVPGFTPSPDAKAHARGGLVRVHEAIERALADGVFVGRTREAIMHATWALLHGLASLELAGALGTPAQAEALWRDACASLLSAFGRPPPR